MHTHTSCFALAEGYFRLSPQSSQGAPLQKERGRSREMRTWLNLVMHPPQGGPLYQRNRPLVSGILLAILVHMLCFGLMMAHARLVGQQKVGGLSTQESKNQTPGILLGQISLSAVKKPGIPSSVPASQAEAVVAEAAVAEAPVKPGEGAEVSARAPALEKTHPAVVEENDAPAVALKAAKPGPTKQPKPAQDARAKTPTSSINKEVAAVAAGVNKSPAWQSSDPVAASAKSHSTDGATEGGFGASGGLSVFGGSDGPSFKRFVKPEYPAQARRQGISGQVLLCISLSAKGSIERVEVVKSAHELLSKAALEAVSRSSFHPLRREGMPVACSTLLPISFNLERS